MGIGLEPYKRGTSGFRGVTWHKRNQVWTARIVVNKKLIYLGSFATAEEAAKEYAKAADHYFGEYIRNRELLAAAKTKNRKVEVSKNTPPGMAARYVQDVVLSYQSDDCLMWPFAVTKQGYGKFQRRFASRVVCELVHGEPPSNVHEAAHSCGVAGCVNPRHIRWATPAENTADKFVHGTVIRGEMSPRAVLTEEVVRLIRRSKPSDQTRLAKQYGVTPRTIEKARLGYIWRHVA